MEGDSAGDDEPTLELLPATDYWTFCTHRKLLLPLGAVGVVHSSAPLSVLLGEGYRTWHLQGLIEIAYHPTCERKENPYWAQLRKKLQCPKVAPMYGDLVVQARGHSLMWNPRILLRELINFFVSVHRRGQAYKFCSYAAE